MHLLKSKCLPTLMFGSSAYPVNKTFINSFDFAILRFWLKFSIRTPGRPKDVRNECRCMSSGLQSPAGGRSYEQE